MISIPNAICPRDGLLLGGQPTEADLQAMKASGYTTIINLRGHGEAGTDVEPMLVQSLGMNYLHIPVNGAAGITVDNALRLQEALNAANDGSVVVHCASGNRVGALFALAAAEFEGLAPELALEKGRAYGLTGLEPLVRQLLQLS